MYMKHTVIIITHAATEDGALLWMYTSDLLKVWIELYT